MFIYDGNVSFAGGQNEGVISDIIRPDQYRRGVNVTTVGGRLSKRPAFRHKKLTFVELPTDRDYEKIFNTGKFQAGVNYDANEPRYIIIVISGIIYQIDPLSYTVRVLRLPDGDRLNQYARRINWTIAGRFLVLYDFPNRPVILDGNELRRSNKEGKTQLGTPLPEVPTSVLGAFVQSRLWVASQVNEFGAGDPVGGLNEDAPITFEESLVSGQDYNGQFFSLGSSNANNPITAMGFLQLADTSTGYGPLIIATKKSIYSGNANTPRATWEQSQFTSLLLFNAGIVGARAFTNSNSDLIFVSADGQVRSLHMGRDEQRRWSNTPISREVKDWLSTSNEELLELTVVETYRNRIFITCKPKVVFATDLDGERVADYAFSGLVVLELDNVSGITTGASSPVWSGAWTGISPTEIINMTDKLFIFSKDTDGLNRLYEVDEHEDLDLFEGQEKETVSRIYSRSYDFQTKFEEKEEGNIEYTLSNIKGNFMLDVDRRRTSSSRWLKWKTWNHHAPHRICDSTNRELLTLEAHDFSEVDLGDPEEKGCDPITKESTKFVRKIEIRVTLKGANWSLQDLRLGFDKKEGDNQHSISCDKINTSIEVNRECELDDVYLYQLAPFFQEELTDAEIG